MSRTHILFNIPPAPANPAEPGGYLYRKGTGFVLYRIARRPELLDTPAGAL